MDIEVERTFLARYLPSDLHDFEFKEMSDNYIPKERRHPILRIRKNGSKHYITRKYQKVEGDNSVLVEETIVLGEDEFNVLNSIDGKRHSKKRYKYNYNGNECEIDVYQGDLKGLVVIDFEFESIEKKDSFIPPDFCLVEITDEEGFAGGFICGKSYLDIEPKLREYGYNQIYD